MIMSRLFKIKIMSNLIIILIIEIIIIRINRIIIMIIQIKITNYKNNKVNHNLDLSIIFQNKWLLKVMTKKQIKILHYMTK
jgi:hypothetical protein